MASENFISKRKHVRFRPDPNDVAYIDTKTTSEEFNSEFAALIVEESPMGGCGVICLDYVELKNGDEIKIKVGKLHPLLAEVMWSDILAKGVKRYGIKFLE